MLLHPREHPNSCLVINFLYPLNGSVHWGKHSRSLNHSFLIVGLLCKSPHRARFCYFFWWIGQRFLTSKVQAKSILKTGKIRVFLPSVAGLLFKTRQQYVVKFDSWQWTKVINSMAIKGHSIVNPVFCYDFAIFQCFFLLFSKCQFWKENLPHLSWKISKQTKDFVFFCWLSLNRLLKGKILLCGTRDRCLNVYMMNKRRFYFLTVAFHKLYPSKTFCAGCEIILVFFQNLFAKFAWPWRLEKILRLSLCVNNWFCISSWGSIGTCHVGKSIHETFLPISIAAILMAPSIFVDTK